MADAFQTLIYNMRNMGFFQFLFPFLLALAIVYGVLTWSLGDRLPRSARGIVSIIVAFFVMLYSSWNSAIVYFFANISGYWLVIGSGILFILILLGLVGVKTEDILKDSKAKWALILAIVFIGILIFFGAGADALINMPDWSGTSEFWTIIFFVVILVVVVWWMGSEGGGKSGGEKPEKT
jgi:hypothetical protein